MIEEYGLIKWELYFNPEFDIFGFEIIPKNVIQATIQALNVADSINKDILTGKYYFGDNNWIYIEQSEILDLIKNYKELTNLEYNTIIKILGLSKGQYFFKDVLYRVLSKSYKLNIDLDILNVLEKYFKE